jgi:mycoredoxin
MPAPIIVYSTRWCGHCHRLKRQLQREGIAHVQVDIEEQPEAAEVVTRANDGDHTVPTVVFADGTALSNPTIAEVKAHLTAHVT